MEYIDQLEDELQRKNNKLEQLIDSHEEMRKSIIHMNRNNEVDAAAIYEQEFERVREHFEEQRKYLSNELLLLQQDNNQLKDNLN